MLGANLANATNAYEMEELTFLSAHAALDTTRHIIASSVSNRPRLNSIVGVPHPPLDYIHRFPALRSSCADAAIMI
ncbi:hypothetical protein D9611_014728 [Ephemerocybe angulata]|uniref:Uncharacterized protein n=1 Tax=Ephemerocybe angulata TaxID=980116 RepID=A0A8H5B9T4_9AGAR|nr:hypothetical protein D9611_014728 [Tulosesus angulatus]